MINRTHSSLMGRHLKPSEHWPRLTSLTLLRVNWGQITSTRAQQQIRDRPDLELRSPSSSACTRISSGLCPRPPFSLKSRGLTFCGSGPCRTDREDLRTGSSMPRESGGCSALSRGRPYELLLFQHQVAGERSEAHGLWEREKGVAGS